MTGGCIVLVQLVLQRCCVLTSGSQSIKHNRIEFVSIVCTNKPLLLVSVLMALFVICTIGAAVIQIVGALTDLKKETEELYETIVNPSQAQDILFDEMVQRGGGDELLPNPAASPPDEPLQSITSSTLVQTPPQAVSKPAEPPRPPAGASSAPPAGASSAPPAPLVAPHVLALPVLRPRAGPAERRLASYTVIAALRTVEDKPNRSTTHSQL